MAEAMGEIAIDNAVKLVQQYLEAAKLHARQDAEQCRYYLQAATIAVRGLEAEYDEILVEAEHLIWLNQSKFVT